MAGAGPPSTTCNAGIKKDVDGRPAPAMTTYNGPADSEAIICVRPLRVRMAITESPEATRLSLHVMAGTSPPSPTFGVWVNKILGGRPAPPITGSGGPGGN